jgi:hypothetical protein
MKNDIGLNLSRTGPMSFGTSTGAKPDHGVNRRGRVSARREDTVQATGEVVPVRDSSASFVLVLSHPSPGGETASVSGQHCCFGPNDGRSGHD